MTEPFPEDTPQAPHGGIVSVNDRGAGGGNPLGKVFLLVGAVGLATVVGFYGYNHYRASRQSQDADIKQTAKNEAKPARASFKRDFDTEQATAASTAPPPVPGTDNLSAGRCPDGSAGSVPVGPDNKPLISAQGLPLGVRVCADGQLIVPGIEDSSAPIALATNAPTSTTKRSRYGGDALLSSGDSPTLSPVAAAAAQVADLAGLESRGNAAEGTGAAGAHPPSASSVGSFLTPSTTRAVQAGFLGDRNMILPKGRSIDCGLSMRLISDLPGLASCIVTQDIYSDNGAVLLLERGSEAVGEYSAGMVQGQRRVFVVWNRIKTPTGVVIDLNSPGADDLGTSGLPGRVDNHWWQRLGAAALLTVVQDAIAYKTAQASGAGEGTLAVYQNTSQTTNDMANTILASTINIKPTLYKNQGDRSTIYVARDLDFGSVYVLKPR